MKIHKGPTKYIQPCKMMPRLPPKHQFKSSIKNLSKDSKEDGQKLNGQVEDSQVRENCSSSLESSSSTNDSPFHSPSVTLNALETENALVTRFAELYSQPESADVSIYCGRKHDVLKAHRYVLSCGSVYFRDALAVAQCKHPVIIVKNIAGDVMSQILEYIYLGQVKLKSESELAEFLSSAKYLQVTGIQNDQFSLTN